MGCKKFKEKVLLRRKEAANLYLKGWYQADIAAKLGVTQQVISNDLKIIYRLWRQSAIRDFDILKERELLKIDNLEQTYWDAWQKSIEDYKKTSKEVEGDSKVAKKMKKKETDVVVFGNPEFLKGVERCIAMRIKILGLEAPAKIDHSSSDGSMSTKNMTISYEDFNDED